MVCSCGNELTDSDVFCPKCGRRQAVATAEPTTGETVAYPDLDFRLYGLFAALAYAASFGLLVILLQTSPGFVPFVVGAFLVGAIGMAAENLTRLLICLLCDRTETIPSVRFKTMAVLAKIVLALPFLFPAYGAGLALYETHVSCVVKGTSKKHGSHLVRLDTYFRTVRDMNPFSLPAYKWIYRSFLEHGEELEEKEKVFSDNPFVNLMPDKREELKQIGNDFSLGLEVSAALMREDFETARRQAEKIKDDDLRKEQLSLVKSAEEIQQGLKKLQHDLERWR